MPPVNAELIATERAKLEKRGHDLHQPFQGRGKAVAATWPTGSRFEALSSELSAEQMAKIKSLIVRDERAPPMTRFRLHW